MRGNVAIQATTRLTTTAFMEEVVDSLATGKVRHVVMDNLATHKNGDEWLAAQGLAE